MTTKNVWPWGYLVKITCLCRSNVARNFQSYFCSLKYIYFGTNDNLYSYFVLLYLLCFLVSKPEATRVTDECNAAAVLPSPIVSCNITPAHTRFRTSEHHHHSTLDCSSSCKHTLTSIWHCGWKHMVVRYCHLFIFIFVFTCWVTLYRRPCPQTAVLTL